MGYAIDATKAAHVIVLQRTMRLGQAMDANTMRWFGAFLFATQISLTKSKHDTTTKGDLMSNVASSLNTTDRNERIHTI